MADPARLRERAAAKRAKAERLLAAADRAADHAPGAYVTGPSGRSRAQNRATARALDQTIDAAVESARLRRDADYLDARARAIETEPERQAARERSRERDRETRAAVARLPILNDPAAPFHLTSAEWAGIGRDYRGIRPSECGRYRVRSAMRGGCLGTVYLVDKPERARS